MILKVFILSLIQSLTEFIPVSSSGHLILLTNHINFNNLDGNLFQISIQLASTIVLCIFFRKKLFSTLITLHKDKTSRTFAYKFILAFLPTAIFGLFFYKYIKNYLQKEIIIAFTLILGGIIILIIEKNLQNTKKIENIDNVNYKKSINIGIFQIFSMIPGVSRSGSTIIGGLLNGLSRKTAVEFSFILAIPTILSATILDLYKNFHYLNQENIKTILLGFIFTFIISSLVIKIFMNYINNHTLKIFDYYRVILGIIILALIFNKF